MQAGVCDPCGAATQPRDVYTTVSGVTGCTSVNGSAVCCYTQSSPDPIFEVEFWGDVGGIGYTGTPCHQVMYRGEMCDIVAVALADEGGNYVTWSVAPASICDWTGDMGTADAAYGTCDVSGSFGITKVQA